MHKLSKALANLEGNLKIHLQNSLAQAYPSIHQVYEYAVFPPGKLIRPLLVKATWCDLTGSSMDLDWSILQPHALLASAIEMHHAYTLIHDDLPCMDDDKERRGKPCTHIQFGEWKALLAGDGLLNASYGLLTSIRLPQDQLASYQQLLRFFSWALGPKGLIQGQVLDLELNDKRSFSELITIHQLKTSRLMQTAIVGSLLLTKASAHQYKRENQFRDFYRIGHRLGIMFQLFDDLSDLAIQDVSLHEKNINPFYSFTDLAMKELLSSAQQLMDQLERHKLHNLKTVAMGLFDKTKSNLKIHQTLIEKKLEQSLDPVMLFLNRPS